MQAAKTILEQQHTYTPMGGWGPGKGHKGQGYWSGAWGPKGKGNGQWEKDKQKENVKKTNPNPKEGDKGVEFPSYSSLAPLPAASRPDVKEVQEQVAKYHQVYTGNWSGPRDWTDEWTTVRAEATAECSEEVDAEDQKGKRKNSCQHPFIGSWSNAIIKIGSYRARY